MCYYIMIQKLSADSLSAIKNSNNGATHSLQKTLCKNYKRKKTDQWKKNSNPLNLDLMQHIEKLNYSNSLKEASGN